MVNMVVAGILQPLKTGGSQSITPPPCIHDSLVLIIMYRGYILSIVYTFYIRLPLHKLKTKKNPI